MPNTVLKQNFICVRTWEPKPRNAQFMNIKSVWLIAQIKSEK
jgi:hypothetical protein